MYALADARSTPYFREGETTIKKKNAFVRGVGHGGREDRLFLKELFLKELFSCGKT